MTVPIAPPPPSYVPEPTSRRPRRLAAALAALAVVAGGFGVVALSAGDGADSPEGAVEALFDAIDHEDLIGVLEALDPSERALLRPAIEETGEEAKRVQLASPDLDLRKVEGFDLTVEGLAFTTEPLGEGIVAVDLTGGWVDSATDLDRMPVGATIRTILDQDEAEAGGDVDRTSSDRIDLDGVRLVATRSGGGWHVSALYSIAEEVRLASEPVRPVPQFGQGIAARGAADPEAAVREAVAAAVQLDVRRLIELTPPGEMAVLHDYGPLLVDAADDARGDDFTAPEVRELELEVADGPDGTRVVSAASFEVAYQDVEGTQTWSYDGSCTTMRTDYSEEFLEEYGDEGLDLPGDEFQVCDEDADQLSMAPIGLVGLYAPGGTVRVVTEQHDGQWFVSPSRSIFESTVGGLRSLTVEDVRRAAQFWRGASWVSGPDEFWEACGVERPGVDASLERGDEAWEACVDALPDDYEGPYGPYGRYGRYGSYDDGSYDDGTSFDEGSGEGMGDGSGDDVTEICYEGPATSDAEVAACLRDLAASGEVPPDAVGELCFYEHPEDEAALAACLRQLVEDGLGSDDLLAEACTFEHTDQVALEACMAAPAPDVTVPGGASPSTVPEPRTEPAPPTVPATTPGSTTVPASTTVPGRPPG